MFKKIFTSDPLKPLEQIADRIEALEADIQKLSDDQLRQMTASFRERLSQGETLDDLLPEAFAVVREASLRTTGLRHYRVQLIGGIVMHQGRIAEMKTGEGKTLAATLPAYLNALSGKGVHIVTVNDYLAKRDSEWMGKIYRFSGMEVGLVVHGISPEDRKKAYAADITHGTNNEFGFDYLRDNMVIYKEQMVQRELNYAIVDEVDSILVDEARTPLIISGQGDKSTELYARANRFVQRLKAEEDFTVDEKMRAATLTEEGIGQAESFFGIENLSDPENTEINHHINQALKAHSLFFRDRDYVVQDGQVIIVDEFTGRLMIGRRYSEGLHQAIEAKEGVKVERESKTLATITFQNYFRMFPKLAGMTGTAKTEEEEFKSIYGLDVVEIPTHMPMIRKDENDVVFASQVGKYKAIIDEIVQVHESGRPVLVGTVSVEKSEMLSKLLGKQGIKHEVLNAKNHQKEAEIVAQAGKLSALTIATNMAGRGTDIMLGGNPDFMSRQQMRQKGFDDEQIEDATSHADTDDAEIIANRKLYNELYEAHKKDTDAEHEQVVAAGGLHIIGTERHESRRIDNQLRGRAGRQGDPGSSRFYVALDDDLMRLFGSEKVQQIIQRLDPGDEVSMDIGMLSKQIESAQKRIESRNFEIRKHVLQYDDVMNQQRELIYAQRRQVLMGEDISASIAEMRQTLIEYAVEIYCADAGYPESWDMQALHDYMTRVFFPPNRWPLGEAEHNKLSRKELQEKILAAAEQFAVDHETEIQDNGGDMREIERILLLRNVDRHWMDHIDAMDQLRQGMGLRGYGQRDPVTEYKFEGFEMFDEMIRGIQENTLYMLSHVSVESKVERKQVAKEAAPKAKQKQTAQKAAAGKKAGGKVGRNDPCPCGSGKKYKQCCGKQ
ncbi:preprotein translocase subunit SecA [Eubacteriales bacterium OttesenSCG-928-N14]|nr:preprotein translocase subunit SecA [Eubacteriales bacterium OttesenSCG-928-N14]